MVGMTDSRALELLEEKLADGATECHIFRFEDRWMVRLRPVEPRKLIRVFRGDSITEALIAAVKDQ